MSDTAPPRSNTAAKRAVQEQEAAAARAATAEGLLAGGPVAGQPGGFDPAALDPDALSGVELPKSMRDLLGGR